MIKKFCDACGKDITDTRSRKFSYGCHLGMPNLGSHSNAESNSVSRRDYCRKQI